MAQPADKTNRTDNYFTPDDAIVPLLPYLPKGQLIWECACGNGHIVRFLQRHKRKVIGSDTKQGVNFLDYYPYRCKDEPELDSPKPLGQVLVTNPPFSLKDDFIDTAYALRLPFAFLMPLDTLHGRRADLFQKHGLELLVLKKRVNFMAADGTVGCGAAFPVGWFCWRLLPAPLMFA